MPDNWTPLPAMAEAFGHRYLSSQGEDTWDNSRFHISDAANCGRAIWYRMMRATYPDFDKALPRIPPREFQQQMIFDFGHAVHRLLQNALLEMRLCTALDIEVPVRDDEAGIRGSVDAILSTEAVNHLIGQLPPACTLPRPVLSGSHVVIDFKTKGDSKELKRYAGGKAQPLDSMVLTPQGWVTMGSLSLGDRVISGDGTETTVTGIYKQGIKPVYRITFNDGSTVECCQEHLWLLESHSERTYHKGASARTVMECIDSLRVGAIQRTNYSIQPVGTVEFDPRPVPIDGYVLGVLLGDGSLNSDSTNFTCSDKEIALEVSKALPQTTELSIYTIKFGATPAYGIRSKKRTNQEPNAVQKSLNLLGLSGHRAWEKFIPDEYIYNSIAVRVSILQGLLDTDGYCDKLKGKIVYVTTSPKLVSGVTEIVRSLGGKATTSIKIHPSRRTAYYVRIALPEWVKPFRLQRKLQLVANRKWRSSLLKRSIVSIDRIGDKEMQCIRVAHPSHLYVTDNYLVTHNTVTHTFPANIIKYKDRTHYTQVQSYAALAEMNYPERYPSIEHCMVFYLCKNDSRPFVIHTERDKAIYPLVQQKARLLNHCVETKNAPPRDYCKTDGTCRGWLEDGIFRYGCQHYAYCWSDKSDDMIKE